MTRAEHIAWCKTRALEYVEAGDPGLALASLNSDLSKHPETAGHQALELGARLMLGGFLSKPRDVRNWIEGIR